MVNHFYDGGTKATRCGEFEGEFAWHISSATRVSCPRCRDTLTPNERAVQWYSFDDEDEKP